MRARPRPDLDARRDRHYIASIVANGPVADVEGAGKGDAMQVRQGMSPTVLTVGPDHSLRAVAKLMARRKVGAAVVFNPDGHGPGIITERDILVSLGAEQDPDTELVADHLTADVVYASPEWSLEEAAVSMVRGGFRHLIVLERGETVGILSVRDVVRCWTDDGAICPVPAGVAA
jgi:CBS domain-containing protein